MNSISSPPPTSRFGFSRPSLDRNLTDRFGTPYEPRLGGAATMLPEYIEKMKAMPRPAKVMTGGGEGGN